MPKKKVTEAVTEMVEAAAVAVENATKQNPNVVRVAQAEVLDNMSTEQIIAYLQTRAKNENRILADRKNDAISDVTMIGPELPNFIMTMLAMTDNMDCGIDNIISISLSYDGNISIQEISGYETKEIHEDCYDFDEGDYDDDDDEYTEGDGCCDLCEMDCSCRGHHACDEDEAENVDEENHCGRCHEDCTCSPCGHCAESEDNTEDETEEPAEESDDGSEMFFGVKLYPGEGILYHNGEAYAIAVECALCARQFECENVKKRKIDIHK